MDRILVTSKLMLNGAYDRNEVQYDSLGNVHQRGAPCTFISCSNFWTTFTYDGLNRVTSEQRPISASNPALQTKTTAYLGRTITVTDALNNLSSHITMPTGWMGRSQDNNGYHQDFTYDAFGSLLTVVDNASPANTLFSATYAYGLKGFQTASTDADLGPKTQTFDALGELAGYTDANGNNSTVIYDALSRPTTRTEPDLTTVWTWGNSAASFNIGKLQGVTAAGPGGTYAEGYSYDGKTRLSSKTVTIPGDTSYTYTPTYNANTGLLDTLQYPASTGSNPLKLQYSYANGILEQVSDFTGGTVGTHFWTANTANPRGQVLQETLGNNVVVNHAFDAVTGWMQSIQAGVGGGAALQNNSYLFDEVGNVTQRQDNNLGQTQNFFYDPLYRLDHATLNGVLDVQMSYDATGNVLTWEADGASTNTVDYTTPQTGCTYYANSQPHARRKDTQGTNPPGSFCYDKNGNLTQIIRSGAVQSSNTWSSYNRPNLMSNGSNGSSQFFYGPTHQRWKQVATTAVRPKRPSTSVG